MAAITEADLRAVFDDFDADKSGEISATELLNALTKVYADDKTKTPEDIKVIAGVSLTQYDKPIEIYKAF